MSTTMKAILRVEVAGSSTSSATHTIEAEGYDRIEVVVPAAGSTPVQVQPGGAGQVQLLQVTSSAYPAAANGDPELGYEVDGGSRIAFDAPLLLVGRGAVSILGDVNSIEFFNDSAIDVEVALTVGRDATP